MSITAQQVITKSRKLLADAGSVRWDDDDLIGWLNSGQREIVSLKPNAFTAYVTVQLVAGTLQSITGVEFIQIVKNMGQSGSTPGLSPTFIKEDILDAVYPGWHTVTASINIKFYTASRKSPKQFMVFPPQPAVPGYAQILQAKYPTEIVVGDIGSATIIDDIYETPLIDYIVARGLAEDTDTADFQKSAAYMQRFMTALGGKAQAEAISEDVK